MKKVNRITAAILLLILWVTTFTPCTVVTAVSTVDISLSAVLSDNGQYINFKLDMREGFSDFLKETYGSDELSLYSLLPYESTDDTSYLLPLFSEITHTATQEFKLKNDTDSLYRSYFIAVKKVELIPLTPTEDTEPSEDASPSDGNEPQPSDDTASGDAQPPSDEGQFEEKITYIPLTEPVYITSQENASALKDPYPNSVSKKGLNIQLVTDAQRLGVNHTVINVPLNDYLSTDHSSEHFVSVHGENVYFDKNAVSLLDHKVKVYSDAGINVIFNFLLTSPSNSFDKSFSDIYFENRDTNADYYAINTSTETGYKSVRACAEFFTSRYTLNSGKGFVGSYIIGYEINSNKTTNSSGPLPISEYIYEYSKLLRIFTTAAVSAYSNSKIYVSVGNSFSSVATSTPDPTLDYPGRDIIELLNKEISEHGNIPWRLSVNPYSSDNSSPAFWADSNVTDSVDSPFISMKNISMLTKYLNQPLFYYNGSPRSVLIGEIGFSSGSGTSHDETQQAAAFAYAYYKAETDPFIDAMIYHRQVDSKNGEASYGLYREGSGGTLEAKKIHEVFGAIDTDSSESATSFALGVVGAQSWGELITGCNIGDIASRRIITSGSVSSDGISSKHTSGNIIPFTQSNFYPSDNTYSLECTDNSINVVTYSAESVEYRGICHLTSTPLEQASYFKLKIKVTADNYTGVSDVMLRMCGTDSDGNTIVYEGTAQVNAATETELYFPVAEYLEIADTESLKIWCKPFTDSDVQNYAFTVTELSAVSESKSGGVIVIIVKIILGILALLASYFLIKFAVISLKNRKSGKTAVKKRRIPKSKDLFD